MTDEVERYIELGLRLTRHEPELLDCYYGPPEVAARVEAEPLRDLRALRTIALRLAGEALTHSDEVEATYGIRPRWFDEARFREAHELLESALPGSEPLRARYARWLEETTVPRELVEPATRAICDEVRELTRRAPGLPEGEGVELEFVEGVRWRGYARYLGGLRSRISINAERPMPASDLVHLIAHEAYPGHHTHRVWQDAELVRRRGQLERTLDLLWSPETVLSEGIAEVGPPLVLEGDGQQLAAACLGELGFDYDVDLGSRVTRARRLLAPVNANVVLLLHDRGASAEQARAYVREWSLQPEGEVETTVEKLGTRRSPGYVHTYSHGLELVGGHVRGDTRRLRELMTARLVPADLRSS